MSTASNAVVVDVSAAAAPPPFLDIIRQISDRLRQGLLKAQDSSAGASFTDDQVEQLYAAALHLVNQGDLVRAQTVLSRVCDLRSGDVRYLRALALTRQELGSFAPAADILQMLFLLEPGEPRHALELAECWLRGGKPDKAQALLRTTVAYCDLNGLTGAVPDRARALFQLLSREGTTNGSDSDSGARANS